MLLPSVRGFTNVTLGWQRRWLYLREWCIRDVVWVRDGFSEDIR